MKNLAILLVLCIFSLNLLNAQEKFDSVKFSDIKKVAEKVAEVKTKALVKYNVKKVMFAECYGEFTTSKETSPSAFEKVNTSSYFVRTSTLEMGSDFYETLTNLVFEEVKKVLTENNIEILDKETLINNPDYIELGLKEEKSAKRYTGGVTKQSTSSEVVIRSVSGMGMYSNTARLTAINKINSMLPKICNDNGCQAAVTVKFRVGMGKGGRPVLDELNVWIHTNIKEYNAGRGKVSYAFNIGNEPIMTTKKGIASEADISGAEKGSVDTKKYLDSFYQIIDGMCRSYSYLLKENMKQ
jgi:hypothetical protein